MRSGRISQEGYIDERLMNGWLLTVGLIRMTRVFLLQNQLLFKGVDISQ